MSDPRNVAHDKKVIQEKKHEGEAPPADAAAVQPGKKPGKKARAPKAAPVPSTEGENAAPAAASAPAPDAATLAGSQVVLAKLKDMEHHSRASLEHLAELTLTVEDELKQKEFSGPLGEVYSAQDTLQTKLTALIASYKAEVDRQQGAGA